MKPLYLLFLAFAFSFASCSSDDGGMSSQPDGLIPADSTLNVSYGNHAQQVYDIYLPEGRSSEYTKVILLIHGGSWIGGDKADMRFLIPFVKEYFPDHAIVNMNYVLASEARPAFPHQFLDVDKVVEQLTKKKEELQILPEFGLIGFSAGGHLALQYDYVYDNDDQVKIVASVVGPTDLTDPYYENNPFYEVLYPILVDEAAYPPGTNYAVAVSPALHVSSASSPTVMFYGNQDPLVPLSNAYLLESKLSGNSVPNQLTIYDGGHAVWDQESYDDMEGKIVVFIEEYLEVAVPVE